MFRTAAFIAASVPAAFFIPFLLTLAVLGVMA